MKELVTKSVAAILAAIFKWPFGHIVLLVCRVLSFAWSLVKFDGQYKH